MCGKRSKRLLSKIWSNEFFVGFQFGDPYQSVASQTWMRHWLVTFFCLNYADRNTKYLARNFYEATRGRKGTFGGLLRLNKNT